MPSYSPIVELKPVINGGELVTTYSGAHVEVRYPSTSTVQVELAIRDQTFAEDDLTELIDMLMELREALEACQNS